MQLSDIRTEVYNLGFDSGLFPASRLNRYINKGYMFVCRRVDYYTDETVYDFSTVSGTIKYAWPNNVARIRDLWDTTRNIQIKPVSLREIDDSGLPGTGAPQYYALDGNNLHLWPTPDAVYTLELRYWLMPSTLVNDTDVPTLPDDWHELLVFYAAARCYEAEDDGGGQGAYWMNRFNTELAEFAADQKFVSTETPNVAKSFWDQERGLTQKGWSLWGWL